MSGLNKVLKKFNSAKKKQQKSASSSSIQRCPSNQSSTTEDKNETPEPFRGRAKTYTDGLTRPRLRSKLSAGIMPSGHQGEEHHTNQFSALEDIQKTFSSPRHFLRRQAVVESQMQDDVNASSYLKNKATSSDSEESDLLTVCVHVEGYNITDSVQTTHSHSLYDIIEYLFMKNDVELKQDLREYRISATRSTEPVVIKLDESSTSYKSCYITIQAAETAALRTIREPFRADHREMALTSVRDCLDFFDLHGLVELPMADHSDDDSYHFPRVSPLDPIPGSWEELPIDPKTRSSLSNKEMDQQRAIWELIYTEYSYLQILETVINVFMRSLEIIRRVNLLSEDNYPSIFGYMEDLYHAHEQLWTCTFEPCLQKTNETNLPLDLNEIINRFPQPFGGHFEVYEQHCALDSFNVKALNKAKQNPEFNAYLKWCEARPECNRLELKQLLVAPMQRLTRYSLLLNAVAKKTVITEQKEHLMRMIEEINEFVHVVNNTVRISEETERVKEVMNKITAYNVGDVPPDVRDLAQCYMQLDLLAPMPDVELDKPRLLMVEGSLHYKDSIKAKMSTVYVFLFTDMLLITKPHRKTSDKYTVVRPPFKITSLSIHSLDSESFCCLVLNEYNALSSWFILKCHKPGVATEWFKQITSAQQLYRDAVEKKVQAWKMVDNLRSERILNGIDHLESLNASLSQSLWSLANNGRLNSIYSSNDSLFTKRASSSSIEHGPVCKTTSAESSSNHLRTAGIKLHGKSGSVDFSGLPLKSGLQMGRTVSVGWLSDRPQSMPDTSLCLNLQGLGSSQYSLLPQVSLSQQQDDAMFHSINRRVGSDPIPPTNAKPFTDDTNSSHLSPFSDDSGSDTPADETTVQESSSENVSFAMLGQKKAKSPPIYYRKKLAGPLGNSPNESEEQVNHLDTSPFHSRAERLNLSNTTRPLKSILSRTPSPKYPPEKPAINTPKIVENNDSSGVRLRPKFRSVGSIDSPDISSLLSPPEGNGFLAPYTRNYSKNFYTMPRRRSADRKPSKLTKSRSLSLSESCLCKDNCKDCPTGSHFDVIYIKDNYVGSQKPNVATVKEEEEAASSEYTKLMSNLDDANKEKYVMRISDSAGEDSDTPPLKPVTKNKVMFSEMAEVCSFSLEDDSDDSQPSTPNALQLIPGWNPKKKPAASQKPPASNPQESLTSSSESDSNNEVINAWGPNHSPLISLKAPPTSSAQESSLSSSDSDSYIITAAKPDITSSTNKNSSTSSTTSSQASSSSDSVSSSDKDETTKVGAHEKSELIPQQPLMSRPQAAIASDGTDKSNGNNDEEKDISSDGGRAEFSPNETISEEMKGNALSDNDAQPIDTGKVSPTTLTTLTGRQSTTSASDSGGSSSNMNNSNARSSSPATQDSSNLLTTQRSPRDSPKLLSSFTPKDSASLLAPQDLPRFLTPNTNFRRSASASIRRPSKNFLQFKQLSADQPFPTHSTSVEESDSPTATSPCSDEPSPSTNKTESLLALLQSTRSVAKAQQRQRKEGKFKRASIRKSSKTVRELSRMFESPERDFGDQMSLPLLSKPPLSSSKNKKMSSPALSRGSSSHDTKQSDASTISSSIESSQSDMLPSPATNSKPAPSPKLHITRPSSDNLAALVLNPAESRSVLSPTQTRALKSVFSPPTRPRAAAVRQKFRLHDEDSTTLGHRRSPTDALTCPTSSQSLPETPHQPPKSSSTSPATSKVPLPSPKTAHRYNSKRGSQTPQSPSSHAAGMKNGSLAFKQSHSRSPKLPSPSTHHGAGSMSNGLPSASSSSKPVTPSSSQSSYNDILLPSPKQLSSSYTTASNRSSSPVHFKLPSPITESASSSTQLSSSPKQTNNRDNSPLTSPVHFKIPQPNTKTTSSNVQRLPGSKSNHSTNSALVEKTLSPKESSVSNNTVHAPLKRIAAVSRREEHSTPKATPIPTAGKFTSPTPVKKTTPTASPNKAVSTPASHKNTPTPAGNKVTPANLAAQRTTPTQAVTPTTATSKKAAPTPAPKPKRTTPTAAANKASPSPTQTRKKSKIPTPTSSPRINRKGHLSGTTPGRLHSPSPQAKHSTRHRIRSADSSSSEHSTPGKSYSRSSSIESSPAPHLKRNCSSPGTRQRLNTTRKELPAKTRPHTTAKPGSSAGAVWRESAATKMINGLGVN